MVPSLAGRDRVLFVGAGASRALGGPGLADLIAPVAAAALKGHGDADAIQDPAAANLAAYLLLVHGVSEKHLRACAEDPSRWSPGIVDLLTVLDLTLGEDSSFGHPAGHPPLFAGGRESREFSGRLLRSIQRSIVGAIATGLGVTMDPCDDDARNALSAYRALVDAFADNGAIMTSNWDSVIDRLIWNVDARSPGTWRPVRRRAVYTPLAEVIVTPYGEPIDWDREPPLPRTPLIKLHGSLNWLYCPRCSRLIVSPTLDLAPDDATGDAPGGRNWVDRTCWCEADADALIVTPSYSKNYTNVQLRAVWREGLQALAYASHWTFVGYSLPSDDFAIRALITRALAWKRSAGLTLESVRVFDVAPAAIQREAEAAARLPNAPSEQAPGAVRDFHALAARYRAVLAEHSPKLSMNAGGLLAAAAAERQ